MKNILIIEDDLAWQDYYKGLLETGGAWRLFFYRDGVSALTKIDEIRPDLLILDMLLTGPTGMAVLHELQSYTDTTKLPVIMVSSVAGELLSDLQSYGVVKLLAKDKMRPEDLLLEVKKWI